MSDSLYTVATRCRLEKVYSMLRNSTIFSDSWLLHACFTNWKQSTLFAMADVLKFPNGCVNSCFILDAQETQGKEFINRLSSLKIFCKDFDFCHFRFFFKKQSSRGIL